MRDNSMMHDATPMRPHQRRLRQCNDMDRIHDLECNDGISKFNEMLVRDSRETGCMSYAVFYEGDGRYLAWRDED